MAGLTGTQIKATYGDVLQCNNTGLGIDATVRIIQDGLGNNSALSLSTGVVRATGTLGVVTSGGTPGTNELDITADGVINLLDTSKDITFKSGGTTQLVVQRAAANNVNATGGVQATFFGDRASQDVYIVRQAAKVYKVATSNSDFTTKGWMQNSAGEAALASAFTNATATLAATNLSWSVAAGRSYRIIGILQVSNTTAAEGIKLAFDGGTATATTFFAAVTAIGSVVAGTLSSTTLAGVINFTTITGTDYIVIHGYLAVNAGGTLTLRAAENTTATGTLTIGPGSWIALADTVAL